MRDLELPGRSPVHAPQGMACTSHPLSSQAAIDVLKAGGNAIDAAVAAVAVQGVVEPGSTGIGGDCFCLYAPQGAAHNIVAFNGSAKAAAGYNTAWFADQGITSIEQQTPHSVTVPSALDAWDRLVRDHGRMPLGEVLQPAIGYARDGYPISSRVHVDFADCAALMSGDENVASAYMPGGKSPEVGQMLRLPALAKTLQTVADEGRDAFYKGEIAQHIVDYLQSRGGVHTMEDFAAVEGIYTNPISTEFRGHTVWECPPNGQGVIALLLLNIMSGFTPDGSGPITEERIHAELEACRLAYRARNVYLADPAYAAVPVEELLSEEFADRMRSAIDPAKAGEPPVDVDLPRHNDTVYVTVVDKDRNACSLINTLFMGFGSGLMDPHTGVLLHCRGMGFSLDPESPNRIEGGKRPLHTIIPGMVTKGDKVVMPFGVMGGHYQSFGHMQFLTGMFDYGLDVQEAMDRPRFMVDPFDGEVEMEETVPKEIRERLKAKGHRIVKPNKPVGGSQAIWIDWDEGVLTGGSDPRKDGCAIGY
ncbi:MAG: gamma-glutamyltransferase [Alphaproteobacteria bacterium]|nr:gamma-glutamyltransferase [Alphaproteobacteria bacterium]